MWGLKRFSTILLASSVPDRQYSPRSVKEMSADFRELYAVLGTKAPVYQQATPTLRFNFVTPPPDGLEWRDDEVFYSDIELMATDPDTLFANVVSRHGDDKPIALYLPGLDGFGISAATWQFDDLSRTYELWRMSIAIEDRTSFGDLMKTVCQFIENVAKTTDRPVYVIGESFGGLLAPAVALRMEKKCKREGTNNPIKGLVLVNPATSFDESGWDIYAPALSSFGFLTENTQMPFDLPSAYSLVGGLVLSSIIPNSEQLQQLLSTIMGLPSLREPGGISESFQGILDNFRLTNDVYPPALLEHRIKNWILVGSPLVNQRLSQLETPTLVVVGTDDKLLPSGNEVRRLTKTIPNCAKLEVKGSGHIVLDGNVNLTEAMVYSKLLDPLNLNGAKTYDPILDWKLPPQKVIDQVREESVNSLEEAFSPIYISTDAEGKRSFGLENLPRDGPLLFVSNHQLLGLDLNMLINKFIEIDLPVRGLAHPVVFQEPNSQRVELEGRIPGLQNRPKGNAGPSTTSFELFGAVKVTPRNYYRLLESGQNALLFPGGVREVFHGRDEAYELLWPEKVDFVRTAAKFNATIIPLSAVGMADSLNILLDPSEIVNIPLLGERARQFAKNITAARFDTANEDENFLPPIVAPGLPSRTYFLFGRPISTNTLDPKDKVACEALYNSVQDAVKEGFRDILAAREKDPYKTAPPRLAYERLAGKKAPTFDVSALDQHGGGK